LTAPGTKETASKVLKIHEIRIIEGFRWIYEHQNPGKRRIIREKVFQPHPVVFGPTLRYSEPWTAMTLGMMSPGEVINAVHTYSTVGRLGFLKSPSANTSSK